VGKQALPLPKLPTAFCLLSSVFRLPSSSYRPRIYRVDLGPFTLK
jgi:hypothetical protein